CSSSARRACRCSPLRSARSSRSTLPSPARRTTTGSSRARLPRPSTISPAACSKRGARCWIDRSTPVRLAGEAHGVAGRLRAPAAGNAAAEDRWAEHGAFETGAAVDVAAGHAGDLACGIEPGDRLEVLVEHAALEVGLDAAEVLARQRENLHRVVRRRVERLRRFQRLVELRFHLPPLLPRPVVARDGGEGGWAAAPPLSRPPLER